MDYLDDGGIRYTCVCIGGVIGQGGDLAALGVVVCT